MYEGRTTGPPTLSRISLVSPILRSGLPEFFSMVRRPAFWCQQALGEAEVELARMSQAGVTSRGHRFGVHRRFGCCGVRHGAGSERASILTFSFQYWTRLMVFSSAPCRRGVDDDFSTHELDAILYKAEDIESHPQLGFTSVQLTIQYVPVSLILVIQLPTPQQSPFRKDSKALGPKSPGSSHALGLELT
jgi:hypothetical protein